MLHLQKVLERAARSRLPAWVLKFLGTLTRGLQLTVHILSSVGDPGRHCPLPTAAVWQAQPSVMMVLLLQDSESQGLSVHSGVILENSVRQRQWWAWI